jgi:hypothetical protein
MGKFCYKIFECEKDTILAIADSRLVGKKFDEEEIEIFVSADFYHEKECVQKDVPKLLKKSTIVNAVGKDIIDIMIKEGVISDKSVLVVGGVPHAQVVTGVQL